MLNERNQHLLPTSLVALFFLLSLQTGCFEETSQFHLESIGGPLLDLGEVNAKSVSFSFKVKVTSRSAVELTQIRTDCSCLIFDDNLVGEKFKSGDEFEINGSISTDGKFGELLTMISIESAQNENPLPLFSVAVKLFIPPAPTCDVATLHFSKLEGQTEYSTECSVILIRKKEDAQLELDQNRINQQKALTIKVLEESIGNKIQGSNLIRDLLLLKVQHTGGWNQDSQYNCTLSPKYRRISNLILFSKLFHGLKFLPIGFLLMLRQTKSRKLSL